MQLVVTTVGPSLVSSLGCQDEGDQATSPFFRFFCIPLDLCLAHLPVMRLFTPPLSDLGV